MAITGPFASDRHLAYDPTSGPKGVDYRGSVWGSPIPLSAGMRRVDGAVIWAGPTRRAEGVPSYTQFSDGSAVSTYITWNVRQSFAVALGYKLDPDAGAPLVRRIWVNGVLAYNNGESAPVVFNPATQVYMPAGHLNASGVWVNSGSGVADSGAPRPPNQSTLVWRFYGGNEDQIPDPEVLAALGAAAPSYRGLMYMVVSDIIVAQGSLYSPTPAPVFPQVSVELVDGTTAGNEDHNFFMLPDATFFQYGETPKLADWENRVISTISPNNDGSFISRFDMDSAVQLSQVMIADGGTPVGSTDNFATWDTLADIYYTTQQSVSMIVSLSPDGVVLDTSLTVAGSPLTAGSTTPDEDDPATKFPAWESGAVDYIVASNQLRPLLCGCALFWTAVVMPDPAGGLPSQLTVEQFYDLDGRSVMVFPLRLYKRALRDHLSFQDAAYLVTGRHVFGGGVPHVDIVYVTQSGGSPKIVGHERVYDGLSDDSSIACFIDGEGHITLQDFNTPLGTTYTRLEVTYDDSPDFGLAPGWRGVFPHVGSALYYRKDGGEVMNQWQDNSLLNSDFSNNTFSEVGATLFTPKDGTVHLIGSGIATGGEVVWDSRAEVLYYHGNIAANSLPLQTFTGTGMRFRQIWSGINGDISQLGYFLRQLAYQAGYSVGQVSVDANLDDQVVGIIINKPYSLSTLFNDIGAVYDFSYFNSAGQLRFARTSNNPLVAEGLWTITGTPADGDTATIGAYVYRFKTTPSQPFDVRIEANTNVATLDNKEKTAANFLAAIAGDIELATSAGGFYPGTTAHDKVTARYDIDGATVFGYTKIALKAVVAGTAGNSIATTETSGQMNFVATSLLGGVEPPDPVADLVLSDLAHVSENSLTPDDALVTTIVPEGQGQRAAQVNYYALEQTYQLLSQTYVPDNQGGALINSSNTVVYDLPFVMSTSEAYSRATKTAIRGADSVVMQNFRLPQSYLLLEPTDVITVTLPPYAYTIKLDECTFNGDFSTSFSAANYLFRSDVPVTGSDAVSGIPQDLAVGSDGVPVVLDTPVRDPRTGTEAGVISLMDGIRAYRVGFSQGALSYHDEEATEFVSVLTTSNDVKWGTLMVPLPEAVEPHYRTVEDHIDVVSKTIGASDVASGDYLDCVEGRNCVAVGSPGNWEYIYFRDAEWLNSKVLRLTGLVRAQRGTDYAVPGHTPADVVLLVDSVAPNFTQALRPQAVDAEKAGDTFTYQATGIPSVRAPVEQTNVVRGYELYPFSPCLLAVAPGTSSSLDLSWVRRDRLSTEYVTNPTTLSETTEEYDLEIMSGPTVVRTVAGLTSPDYNYSSADQTTDGFTPPMSSIKFRVYQKGELGRGFPREENVDVS